MVSLRKMLWLGIFAPFIISAQGDVYLKIQRQGFQPVSIFVSPLNPESGSSMVPDIDAVLRDDLAFSGFFTIQKDMGPPVPVVRAEGEVKTDANGLVCHSRLADTATRQEIFRKTYKTRAGNGRQLAHQWADDIVQVLIGDYGVSTSRIAYVHRTGQTGEIMLTDYDGHGTQRLTSNQSVNLSPAFSPDGKTLIFTSYSSGNADLVFYDFLTGQIRTFSRVREMHTCPAWSPDGREIAYARTRAGNTDIYIVAAHGGTPRRLTSGPSIDCSPSWSPDSRELVFTSDRSGTPQLYLMDAEGTNLRRLTYAGSYNDSPVWSPRGDLIAYVSRESGGFQIYTIDPAGENIRRLTDGRGNHEDPAWSPDGFFLAFASNKEGAWNIYTTSWNGRGTRRLTQGGGNVSPAWSPRLSWALNP